jgi:hypothetical protein
MIKQERCIGKNRLIHEELLEASFGCGATPFGRLTVLLVHLLKWQFQPARRSKSWRNTLTVQRSDVLDLLEDSPSLRYELEQHIEKAYEKAKLIAEDETGIEKAHFPQRCPYSFEQIVDQEFFPEQEEPSTA